MCMYVCSYVCRQIVDWHGAAGVDGAAPGKGMDGISGVSFVKRFNDKLLVIGWV